MNIAKIAIAMFSAMACAVTLTFTALYFHFESNYAMVGVFVILAGLFGGLTWIFACKLDEVEELMTSAGFTGRISGFNVIEDIL